MVCGGKKLDMCGRYTLFDEDEDAEITAIVEQIRQNYPDVAIKSGDIYPTNTAPVVLANGGRLTAQPVVWGFPKFGASGVIINARAETAWKKTMFAESLKYRRCVVPSTGFYEWDREKRKYLFRLPGETSLYMAGLWRDFDGERRLVILTTAANASMADVHDRMPVILPRELVRAWATDTEAAVRYITGAMPQLCREEVS